MWKLKPKPETSSEQGSRLESADRVNKGGCPFRRFSPTGRHSHEIILTQRNNSVTQHDSSQLYNMH